MKSKQSNPTPALPLSGEGVSSQKDVVSRKTQTRVHSAPPPEKGEVGRGLKRERKSQLHNLKQQGTKRRELRQNPTEPEKYFWSWVRGKQLGTKFRRQHGIGNYIVDFYCAEFKLVIELDGDSHFTPESQTYDQLRTDFLNSKGFRVLRFYNQDIMNNKDGVLAQLVTFLEQKESL